ncbi:hypothetical protein HK100_011151 [Physocladia obscura]|uniref:C2H2-type domain-containing protein n=1 Tax=Physocladia obscura TaxID=109957 RepID=A0AAD5T321_9FUNG|nr:hypothetical protein HK100_011151 [Physocladia obscura]
MTDHFAVPFSVNASASASASPFVLVKCEPEPSDYRSQSQRRTQIYQQPQPEYQQQTSQKYQPQQLFQQIPLSMGVDGAGFVTVQNPTPSVGNHMITTRGFVTGSGTSNIVDTPMSMGPFPMNGITEKSSVYPPLPDQQQQPQSLSNRSSHISMASMQSGKAASLTLSADVLMDEFKFPDGNDSDDIRIKQSISLGVGGLGNGIGFGVAQPGSAVYKPPGQEYGNHGWSASLFAQDQPTIMDSDGRRLSVMSNSSAIAGQMNNLDFYGTQHDQQLQHQQLQPQQVLQMQHQVQQHQMQQHQTHFGLSSPEQQTAAIQHLRRHSMSLSLSHAPRRASITQALSLQNTQQPTITKQQRLRHASVSLSALDKPDLTSLNVSRSGYLGSSVSSDMRPFVSGAAHVFQQPSSPSIQSTFVEHRIQSPLDSSPSPSTPTNGNSADPDWVLTKELQSNSAKRSKLLKPKPEVVDMSPSDTVEEFDSGGKSSNGGRGKNNSGNPNNSSDNRPRDFVCATCNNKFLRRQDLSRHEVTHAKTKQFSCPLGCGTYFGRSDALTRHLKTRRCSGAQ